MTSALLPQAQAVMDDSCGRWPTKPFLDFSVAPKSQFVSEKQRADGFPWFPLRISSSIWRQRVPKSSGFVLG